MQLRFILGGIAVASYAAAAYYTATHAQHTLLAVLIAIGPLSFATLLFVRKTLGLAALAVAGLGLGLLIYRFMGELQAHITTTYYLQHLGMQFCGGLFFGLSLIPPRVPLCTRFASLVHDVMTPEHERYTRWVTVAWSLFFVLMAVISTLLFFSSLPFAVWAAFEAFFTMPMLALMFAGEYLVRRLVLPNETDHGITSAWNAYKAYRAQHAAIPKK